MMKIEDKIKAIINDYSLSSSQFADKIGIQRSTVSHILASRNKPSYDVLKKILSEFTNVNSDWLLRDDPEMYIVPKNQEKSLFEKNITISKEKSENDDLSNNKNLKEKIELQDTNKKKEDVIEINTDTNNKKKKEKVRKKKKNKKSKNDRNTKDNIKTKSNKKQQSSSLSERIIIFNDDRTYTEYVPRL